jgi:hypothetical protein
MADDNPVGRPTVMTPDVLAKLTDAFALGHSDREACLLADIDPKTLYRYCEDNPDFASKKELLKETPTIKARRNIMQALNDKSVGVSQWYLERKSKEFVVRSDITTDDKPITPLIIYKPEKNKI